MDGRPRLADGAPGAGFSDRRDYLAFDQHLLPLLLRRGSHTAASFAEMARSAYDIHPWTVSRWLWEALARGLIEATDEAHQCFRVKPGDVAIRIAETREP
jgi:hypothetical protein